MERDTARRTIDEKNIRLVTTSREIFCLAISHILGLNLGANLRVVALRPKVVDGHLVHSALEPIAPDDPRIQIFKASNPKNFTDGDGDGDEDVELSKMTTLVTSTPPRIGMANLLITLL